jgi:hypothetical protein
MWICLFRRLKPTVNKVLSLRDFSKFLAEVKKSADSVCTFKNAIDFEKRGENL